MSASPFIRLKLNIVYAFILKHFVLTYVRAQRICYATAIMSLFAHSEFVKFGKAIL